MTTSGPRSGSNLQLGRQRKRTPAKAGGLLARMVLDAGLKSFIIALTNLTQAFRTSVAGSSIGIAGIGFM